MKNLIVNCKILISHFRKFNFLGSIVRFMFFFSFSCLSFRFASINVFFYVCKVFVYEALICLFWVSPFVADVFRLPHTFSVAVCMIGLKMKKKSS